jgi:hypothetical protein
MPKQFRGGAASGAVIKRDTPKYQKPADCPSEDRNGRRLVLRRTDIWQFEFIWREVLRSP